MLNFKPFLSFFLSFFFSFFLSFFLKVLVERKEHITVEQLHLNAKVWIYWLCLNKLLFVYFPIIIIISSSSNNYQWIFCLTIKIYICSLFIYLFVSYLLIIFLFDSNHVLAKKWRQMNIKHLLEKNYKMILDINKQIIIRDQEKTVKNTIVKDK